MHPFRGVLQSKWVLVLPGLSLGPDGAFLLTVDNLRTNVNAKFAYQRMAFPQFGGNGRAQVVAVGGFARLQIRVANDGAGRPMVNVIACFTVDHCSAMQCNS